jgi:hypothetical protein
MERPSVISPPSPDRLGDRTGATRVKGPIRRAAGAIQQGGALVVERVPAPVLVLLLTLIIPTAMSFYVGTLRISPYRIVLLVMTPILFIQLITGGAGKVTFSDRLVLASTFWMWAALVVNDGGQGIESGGIGFLETCGAFLIARCCIRTAGQWVATATVMGVIIAAMAPLVVFESLSGVQVIKLFFVGHGPGGAIKESLLAKPRMGFYRASGPFDHPILLGVISAAVTSAVGVMALRRWSVIALVPFTFIATICSISSGALAGLAVTGVLASWEQITKSVPRRWVVFLIIFAIFYGIIEMLSNRSALVAVLSVVTLNPKTAMDRTIIWEWGFHYNAVVHPYFGLGKAGAFNWVRPGWLGESVDNYFLFLMILHGIVAVAMLLLAIVVKVRNAALAGNLPGVHGLASSWWIAMVAFVISGWTVALWNHAQIMFWFLLGAGSWIEQQYFADKAARKGRKRVAS